MAFTADQALAFLKLASERQKLPHALLICDPSGNQAPQLVSALISFLNNTMAKPLDEMEDEYCRIIRPRSKSRKILVSEIRAIEPFFQQQAASNKVKIGVFPEAECINEQAFNAFLKTLEEPPAGTLIILITQAPEQLMPTILSRCVRLDLFSHNTQFVLSPLCRSLLPTWIEFTQHLGNELETLAFRTYMLELLSSFKKDLTKRLESELKIQAKKYAETTGVTDWERQMADTVAASIESEYIQERHRILDFMITWFGDTLRTLSKSPYLELADYKQHFETLKNKETLESLIKRIDALEQLRKDLKTNVHEALAFDVRLLEAFA